MPDTAAPASPTYPVRQSDLGDIGDLTNAYNTPIPPEKQAAFDSWVATQKQATGRDPLRDRYDYDVNGDWLAGAARDERGHGSDRFKKPNHPTFSDQSQYQGQDGYLGGHWDNDAQGNYVSYSPSKTNLTFRSPEELSGYFQQVEPDTKLRYRAAPAARKPAPAPPAKRRLYGQ